MPPRARWPVIVYGLLSWAGAFYHLILFAFLKRDVESALHLAPSDIRWIEGLTFAAAAIGGFVLGRAADLGARRLVLALAPGLPALGSLWLAHADGVLAVTLARLVVGFGVGGGWGVGHAVLASIYDGKKLLRAAAILQTGGPIAVISAALTACILIPAGPDGWRTLLSWSAVTAAIGLLDPWAMGRASPIASAPPTPTVVSRPAIPRAAWGIFGLLVLQMTAYWCTFAWLPSHLLLQGASRAGVGWIQIATGATQGLADLLFGWLSPRVGVRRLFALCNVAFGAGVVALAAAFPTIAANDFALAATIAAVGLGSGSWAAFGPLFAQHVPAAIRGSASSTSYHLARASQLVVHPLVGVFGPAGATQVPSLLIGALAAWAGAAAIHALRPPQTPASGKP